MSAHSLPRTERLRSLGAVRRLFESGESGFIFPFRYVWFAEPDTEQSVEVLFSVPKKFHKGGLPPAKADSARRTAGQPGPGADLLVEGDAAL